MPTFPVFVGLVINLNAALTISCRKVTGNKESTIGDLTIIG